MAGMQPQLVRDGLSSCGVQVLNCDTRLTAARSPFSALHPHEYVPSDFTPPSVLYALL